MLYFWRHLTINPENKNPVDRKAIKNSNYRPEQALWIPGG
jgi:hypothetical protein